jgi:hypothetical protein
LEGILKSLPLRGSHRIFTFPFDPDKVLAPADSIFRKKENKNGQKEGFQGTVAE